MSDSTNKKKILILGPLPPPYMGPTLATEVILKSKLNDEFDIHHLDTSDHRSTDTLGEIDFWNLYLPLKHYVQLIFVLIIARPELVYIPISQTTIGYLKDSGFILIAKLFQKKVLCHLRGGNFKNWLKSAGRMTNWYVRRIHKLVDGQIVLGQKLRNLFEGIIPNSRIFVVPNGKDIQVKSFQKPYGKLKILFLSNLIESKGVLEVLKCVPFVIGEFQDVEFQFVGDWSDKATELKILAFKDENPNLPLSFSGVRHGNDKEKILGQADIFVFPTYYPPEGHPWVVIEAMAYGLPIITTDHAAITESVFEGVNGFIVEKQSPRNIAEKILVLLNENNLRKKMGQASRELYLQHFTEKVMVKNLHSAFSLTLSSRNFPNN